MCVRKRNEMNKDYNVKYYRFEIYIFDKKKCPRFSLINYYIELSPNIMDSFNFTKQTNDKIIFDNPLAFDLVSYSLKYIHKIT